MKTIFVPTDLSVHSFTAFRYALDLARTTGVSKIVVFHHNPQVYTGEIPVLYLDDLTKINDDLKAYIEKEIQTILSKKDPGLNNPATEVVVQTDAGTISAILEQARKSKADLIVMGSHGKTGLSRLVFGSVTAGLIEVSKIPVLAIPEDYKFKEINTISYASSLKHFQKELHALKHFLGDKAYSIQIVYFQYSGIQHRHLVDAQHLLKSENDPRVHLEVIESQIDIPLVDQILSYTRKKSPDWLVMFPEKKEWYEKLFLSSKTLELLSHFRRPLLVLHKG
jgi:nucleotide-binding universal stress UspA family protein